MTETRSHRKSWADDCQLRAQGRWGGACGVVTDDEVLPACVATLRRQGAELERLVETVHLSRPENYLSIYQSGCNFASFRCKSGK